MVKIPLPILFISFEPNQRFWIKKCKFCNSLITHKYGIRLGRQRYKCLDCKKVFTGGKQISVNFLWDEYTRGKQTYIQLANKYGCSKRTIQRKLDLYQEKKV